MTPRLLLAGLAVLLISCTGDADSERAADTATSRSITSSTPAASHTTPAPVTEGTCPLTIPNGHVAPGGNDAGMNHGNGKLWTAMWSHNVVIATPDYIEANGSVGMKWPWWRGVKGKLTITGRRLDGKAPPISAYMPDYGKSGFQPSGISFPTEGCWEVTGVVGDAKLTFVTLILKASRYWPVAKDG